MVDPAFFSARRIPRRSWLYERFIWRLLLWVWVCLVFFANLLKVIAIVWMLRTAATSALLTLITLIMLAWSTSMLSRFSCLNFVLLACSLLILDFLFIWTFTLRVFIRRGIILVSLFLLITLLTIHYCTLSLPLHAFDHILVSKCLIHLSMRAILCWLAFRKL